MPPHIQTVLSASSEPLDKLAIIADKVSEVKLVRPRPHLCCHNCSSPSQSSSCSAQPTMDSLASWGWREPPRNIPARLFLLDRKSGQKFLIDSGSEICVIPPSPTMNKSPQS
ncbi:hypothetical protein TNCV_3954991 [Trichonephila clavipes]|nr:hypothetical protein TNCV_3954991 [Trichonephila clavipes]